MTEKKTKVRSLAIVAKLHGGSETLDVVATLIAWLKKRRIRFFLEKELASDLKSRAETFELSKFPKEADFVLVLGGDGTLISAARGMRRSQLPLLGVNLGSLGFMTHVALKDLYKTLAAVIDGDFELDRRIMLRATLERRGEILANEIVLNDVVITKGAIARIIEVGVDIDAQFVAVMRADGLIVSTPTGSTAYSLGAGGPILYPSLDAMILTPICPHTLTNRPVVVSDKTEIQMTLRGDPGEVYVTFDGQASERMAPGDLVRVRKSRYGVRLIRPRDHNYFQVLRHKLRWAERPRARRRGKIPSPKSG